MEKLDGQIRWEHWGVSMGSNRSSHSSFRTVAKPAKKCLVREFQEELSDYLNFFFLEIGFLFFFFMEIGFLIIQVTKNKPTNYSSSEVRRAILTGGP